MPRKQQPDARRRAHHSGTVEKRGHNYYIVKISYGRDPETGKRLREAHTVRGPRAEADAVLRDHLAYKKSEHYRPVGRAARQQPFGQYALDAIARNPKASAATQARMGKLFETYTSRRLRLTALGDISPALLIEERDALMKRTSRQSGQPLAPRTINLALSAWGRVLQMAVQEQRILVNPMRGLTRAAEKDRAPVGRALDPADTARLLQVADADPLAALWRIMLTLGLRPSEALALSWHDVRLEAPATLRVERALVRLGTEWRFGPGKTKKSRRSIPLPLPVLAALRVHRKRQAEERLAAGEEYRDHDLVFADPRGAIIAPWVIQKQWKALLRAAGLPTAYRLYDARHTAATRLVETGLDFLNVAGIIGNSPKMVGEVYGHARLDMQRDALDCVAAGTVTPQAG